MRIWSLFKERGSGEDKAENSAMQSWWCIPKDNWRAILLYRVLCSILLLFFHLKIFWSTRITCTYIIYTNLWEPADHVSLLEQTNDTNSLSRNPRLCKWTFSPPHAWAARSSRTQATTSRAPVFFPPLDAFIILGTSCSEVSVCLLRWIWGKGGMRDRWEPKKNTDIKQLDYQS